ncbi:uncharacterized protein [Dysidea avara]|uniref:uncharacterized protein isoform X1 n=2 Tax=Dysidea avara TaxID=196820 RepID=UPI00331BFF2C
MEGQVALTPGNNIIDNQNSLENTAVGTSSQTPFVMGRRIARNSILNRMDCRHDEMKSEHTKLQSQLKEFEKKQADYEEELKKAKQETEQAQQNMRHELRQLEDNKKKME